VEVVLEKDVRIRAILDSRSDINLLSQGVYDRVASLGMDIPTLPVENVTFITAFVKRSNRVRKQAFTVGAEVFEAKFFISPQLVNDAILGFQFMKDLWYRLRTLHVSTSAGHLQVFHIYHFTTVLRAHSHLLVPSCH
jgi:hypothetical protein